MKKLLGIFAHPDDESVVAGGTIAKYAKNGWDVDLVCATRGEAGVWSGISHTQEDRLADVRSAELAEAARTLGVRSITFLDYKDGSLAQKKPGDIEDAIIRVLEEIRPDVIVTYEPGGMTNHPDHAKLSYAATYAFQVYAKAHEEETADNPPKLYYACYPDSEIAYLIKRKYFPAEINGRPMQGVDDKRITTVIDITRFASDKVNALDAHRTQRENLTKYVSMPKSPFFRHEYFILRMTGVTEVFMGKNDRVSDRL